MRTANSAIFQLINKDSLIVIKIDSIHDLIDFLQLGGQEYSGQLLTNY